jgi:RNAse (barnase) inhibitor barstar
MNKNVLKIYNLKGRGFELARQYDALAKQSIIEQSELEERFSKEQAVLMARYKNSFLMVWAKIMDEIGLDTSITWDNPAFGIERTYIDQGFAAIIELIEPKEDIIQTLTKNKTKIPKHLVN